jgi:hypothetical protein
MPSSPGLRVLGADDEANGARCAGLTVPSRTCWVVRRILSFLAEVL